MEYDFQYKPYRRPFLIALTKGYGSWTERQGVLVRLEDAEGQVGFGEIAPLKWFGTEWLAHALVFCESLGGRMDDETIDCIGTGLPCCRFAFESARSTISMDGDSSQQRTLAVTALLPSGIDALEHLPKLLDQGYTSFKLKIGIKGLRNEQWALDKIMNTIPSGAHLRLDANCRLFPEEAHAWFQFLEGYEIEFLEQPLGPDGLDDMRELAEKYNTRIALDESVAGMESMRQVASSGWNGVLTVKPSIMGDPGEFLEWAEGCSCLLVFSSVFETVVGMSAGLKLAARASSPDYAIGYGVHHFFPADDVLLSPRFCGPSIDPHEATVEDFEDLWRRITKD